MAMFTLYQRSITAGTIRSIEDLQELTMPTGNLWLSPDRDDCYQKIAIIEAGSLDNVWHLTQNIDAPWTQNTRIKFFWVGNPRSSMIGDVIVHENGDAWMIDRGGTFTLIETGKHRQVKFDMSIPDAPPINDLGQEIIDHIHRMLKASKYKHPMKNAWLTTVERIVDGSYFNTEGLLRLAHNLNVP